LLISGLRQAWSVMHGLFVQHLGLGFRAAQGPGDGHDKGDLHTNHTSHGYGGVIVQKHADCWAETKEFRLRL
jgi:hypothetical protein